MRKLLIINGERYDISTAHLSINITTDSTVVTIDEYSHTPDEPSPTSNSKAVSDKSAILDELIVAQVQQEVTVNEPTSLFPPPSIADEKLHPAKGGILPRSSTLETERVMNADEIIYLRQYRRDLEIKLKVQSDVDKYGFTIAKTSTKEPITNKTLTSPEFYALTDDAIRQALLQLVFEEQRITSDVGDRENFLLVQQEPKLLLKSITNEVEGKGIFQFSETVSVYMNPDDSKRSHPPNGMDTR